MAKTWKEMNNKERQELREKDNGARAWRIAETSNFDLDYYTESWVSPILYKTDAETVAKIFNRGLATNSAQYYKVVHFKYELNTNEP